MYSFFAIIILSDDCRETGRVCFFFGILFNFIKRGDKILTNSNQKNSKNLLFSNLCKNFHVEKKRKKFREWLLYNTTLDPFLLSVNLSEKAIREIEDWLKKKQNELLKQEIKESGSSL